MLIYWYMVYCIKLWPPKSNKIYTNDSRDRRRFNNNCLARIMTFRARFIHICHNRCLSVKLRMTANNFNELYNSSCRNVQFAIVNIYLTHFLILRYYF